MSLQPFITNPYMEGIYRSFLGSWSDEEYYQLLESAVKKQLGARWIQVQKVECGVGLAYIARCVFAINDGSIRGNDIEQPFLDIENGQYFSP